MIFAHLKQKDILFWLRRGRVWPSKKNAQSSTFVVMCFIPSLVASKKHICIWVQHPHNTHICWIKILTLCILPPINFWYGVILSTLNCLKSCISFPRCNQEILVYLFKLVALYINRIYELCIYITNFLTNPSSVHWYVNT